MRSSVEVTDSRVPGCINSVLSILIGSFAIQVADLSDALSEFAERKSGHARIPTAGSNVYSAIEAACISVLAPARVGAR